MPLQASYSINSTIKNYLSSDEIIKKSYLRNYCWSMSIASVSGKLNRDYEQDLRDTTVQQTNFHSALGLPRNTSIIQQLENPKNVQDKNVFSSKKYTSQLSS